MLNRLAKAFRIRIRLVWASEARLIPSGWQLCWFYCRSFLHSMQLETALFQYPTWTRARPISCGMGGSSGSAPASEQGGLGCCGPRGIPCLAKPCAGPMDGLLTAGRLGKSFPYPAGVPSGFRMGLMDK